MKICTVDDMYAITISDLKALTIDELEAMDYAELNALYAVCEGRINDLFDLGNDSGWTDEIETEIRAYTEVEEMLDSLEDADEDRISFPMFED